jgi:hypothetical protein
MRMFIYFLFLYFFGLNILFLENSFGNNFENLKNWKSGEYFKLKRKILFSPAGEKFYIRGIAYAPLENHKYPIRNNIEGLKEDIFLIKSLGFNTIKLWNAEKMLEIDLLKDFLSLCEKLNIGVIISLMPYSIDNYQKIDIREEKIEEFKNFLRKLAKVGKDYKSLIFYGVWLPPFKGILTEKDYKKIIEEFVKTLKEIDKNHLVSIFTDLDPEVIQYPKKWGKIVDLIGVQPYSRKLNNIDKERIDRYISYFKNKPIYIDEWGFLTYSPFIIYHGLTKRKEKNIAEFIEYVETKEILGWIYFMLRDKETEGDWGIIEYDYKENKNILRKSAEVFKKILVEK